GGPPHVTPPRSAWPRINCRSCSRPATRSEREPRPIGGQSDHGLDRRIRQLLLPRCGHKGIPLLSERTQRLFACHGWWIMSRKKPEVMDVDYKRLQAVVDRAKESLAPEDAEYIE